MMKMFGLAVVTGLFGVGLTHSIAAHDSIDSELVTPEVQARLDSIAAHAGIDTVWRASRDHAVAKYINPADYECGFTDFDYWIFASLDQLDNTGSLDNFITLYFLGVLDWPTLYSLILDHDASDDYIGVFGEHTQELLKRHKDNQRFWNVATDDVLLQGMHGSVIADDSKMVPLVMILWDVDEDFAQFIVDMAQDILDNDPGIGYDSPWFTLNAIAFSEVGECEDSILAGRGIPDKIVMGDGILEVLTDLGFGENGPDAVHAHEFAHHVQFELGVYLPCDEFDEDITPEFTRYTELMADALGAYYCAHARGAAFQARRVMEVIGEAYVNGDCVFDSPFHHGTPNQREAAARWGVNLATSVQKQGHIISPDDMRSLFDDVYEELIAPDAP